LKKIFLNIGKGFDQVLNLSLSISLFLMIFMLVIVTLGVVLRYFIGISFPAIYELIEYSMLYFTMLAAPSLFRSDKHIKMEFLVEKVQNRTRAILNLVTTTISLVMSTVITWFAISLTFDQFIMSRMEQRVLNILFGYIIMAIPIGFFFITLQLLRQVYKLAFEFRNLKK